MVKVIPAKQKFELVTNEIINQYLIETNNNIETVIDDYYSDKEKDNNYYNIKEYLKIIRYKLIFDRYSEYVIYEKLKHYHIHKERERVSEEYALNINDSFKLTYYLDSHGLDGIRIIEEGEYKKMYTFHDILFMKLVEFFKERNLKEEFFSELEKKSLEIV